MKVLIFRIRALSYEFMHLKLNLARKQSPGNQAERASSKSATQRYRRKQNKPFVRELWNIPDTGIRERRPSVA
jgi:hypothetical protein